MLHCTYPPWWAKSLSFKAIQTLLSWAPKLFIGLLAPTVHVLLSSNKRQLLFCSWYFERHGKLIPILAGEREGFLSLAECAVFRRKRKFLIYDLVCKLVNVEFVYFLMLLTAKGYAAVLCSLESMLPASMFSLSHTCAHLHTVVPPPSCPPPGEQPTRISFGKQQHHSPVGAVRS